MANEVTIPVLACRLLDESLPFYEALGFDVTYRQARPNPYAVVRREDLELHLFGQEGFEPEQSLGNVIVVVPDPDALYRDFADGLRAAYGTLPSAGIPRITRPRKKQGTVGGFSVIDPGGNWLRVSRAGDAEDAQDAPGGLERVVRNAARQGDARGDHAAALQVLAIGLRRHADATPVERVPALVYRAELEVRIGDTEAARSTLAEVEALDLDPEARAAVAADLAAAAELQRDLT